MEENNTPAHSPKSSSVFRIITLSLLFLAFGLVAAGSYFTGRLQKAKVLGTEQAITPTDIPSAPTTIPTEIPSLADETTPTPTLSPTPTPTPKPIVTINPLLKLKTPELQIKISPTSTPTPIPTIKFEQLRPELQIQP